MLSFEDSITFLAGKEPPVRLRNFWEPENGFVWSTDRWCEVAFPFDFKGRPANGAAELILDLDVFKVDEKLPGQNIMIYLNGLRIGSIFCHKRVIAVLGFDGKILNKDENTLTIDTPEHASPFDFGGLDKRSLALQLFSIQIRNAG